MEEKIDKIYQLIKETFPEATYVSIEASYHRGIVVKPIYDTNLPFSNSMRTITGKWVKNIKE